MSKAMIVRRRQRMKQLRKEPLEFTLQRLRPKLYVLRLRDVLREENDLAQGGRTTFQIARLLGRNPNTVRRMLLRLEFAGVLVGKRIEWQDRTDHKDSRTVLWWFRKGQRRKVHSG